MRECRAIRAPALPPARPPARPAELAKFVEVPDSAWRDSSSPAERAAVYLRRLMQGQLVEMGQVGGTSPSLNFSLSLGPARAPPC